MMGHCFLQMRCSLWSCLSLCFLFAQFFKFHPHCFFFSPSFFLFLSLIHRLVSSGSKTEVAQLKKPPLDVPALNVHRPMVTMETKHYQEHRTWWLLKSRFLFSISQGPQQALVPQPLLYFSQPSPLYPPSTDVTASRASHLHANRRQTRSARAAVLKCEGDARETHTDCTAGVLLI